MPTYEYRCANGHHFEQVQRMTEPPIEKCPECGAAAERQLSAGAGLLFKGSGFYITDYRSDSYKKAAQADSAGGGDSGQSSGKSDSKSDNKSDNKSDSKSESKPTGSSSGSGESAPKKSGGDKGTS